MNAPCYSLKETEAFRRDIDRELRRVEHGDELREEIDLKLAHDPTATPTERVSEDLWFYRNPPLRLYYRVDHSSRTVTYTALTVYRPPQPL